VAERIARLVDLRLREPRPVEPVGPVVPLPVPPRPIRLKPGQPGPAFTITTKELQALVRKVLTVDGARVVWTVGGAEAAVHLDATRVATHDGLILVALTLATDQTGPQELTVVLAVGGERRPAGLVALAEERPRGHPELARVFGTATIATAWRALIEILRTAAAASGRDARDDPLLPAGVTASAEGIRILPVADLRLGERIE
jgi:hypothetical protein